ncbi:MAG: 16S rRNA (guanine(966)-N(2))-methyltransferase RsmD [Candidatus Neomarinimicrobiota bacterium]|nr:MAG: 16S rRNA (guanine(966)-N(2))-methyltransferase RsmD [Candidatus Neomarinimicrobiota bacterium]
MVKNVIRVVSGIARGRKLFGPSGLRFRPTTGRVKEFMFSYLGEIVKGARILDLFSGTGSLGIEALSRGAEEVVFVEKSSKSLEILKRNLTLCGFVDRAVVLHGDVFHVLRRMGEKGERFDFILADPPFRGTLRDKIVKIVAESRILKPEGLLLIEHEVHDSDSETHGMELLKQRRFGSCVVSVYGELE